MTSSTHLITGGSGVLGSAVARELVEHGYGVRILDPKPPPQELSAEVEYVPAGVHEPDALIRAAKGCEAVHHLAASMPQAKLSARRFWEINVGGTMNVADAAIKAGVKRMVFASTIEIYGLQYPHEFPVTEQSEKRFTGIYSRNKLECEHRLMEISKKRGLEVVFPRMPMIFGPGFYHEASMTLLFRLIRKSRPVPVVAGHDAPWASVSSADAGQAFRLCAEVSEANGEAFNIAAPDAPPCRKALEELIERAGSRSLLLLVPTGLTERAVRFLEMLGDYSPTPAELARFVLVGGIYSIDKAKSVLGYHPCHSAVDAMESAYRYCGGL